MMRSRWFYRTLWGLVAAGAITIPAAAQRVQATLSHDSITVGDRFTLTLSVLHGYSEAPSFPGLTEPDSVFGDLVPIDLASAGMRVIEPGVRLDSVVYNMTTFALDTAHVGALPVSFDSGATFIRSTPMFLPVISLVPQEATSIRDLADPVEFGRPVWPYFLLGLAVIMAGVLVWYFFFRQRKPDVIEAVPTAPGPRPQDVALARLRALGDAPLATRPQVEAYYVELSDTARTYLEQRLEVPALEITTQELTQALLGARIQHMVPGGIPQQVERVLNLADLVKFADVTPPAEEGRDALGETVTIVERIETKLTQIMAREPVTAS